MSKQHNTPVEEIIIQTIHDSSKIAIDDDRLQATLETLHQYLPNLPQPMESIRKLPLLLRLKLGFKYISPSYWFVSITLYILCLLLTLNLYNPYMTMFFSPLPFIIMFFQDTRGREPGLLEIELACPYSPHEIMVARMIIIAFYNLIAMSLFSIILYQANPNNDYFHLLITWITPFILVANITLWMLRSIRSNYMISSIILIWFSLIMWLMNTPKVMEWLFSLSLIIYIVLASGGLLLLLTQLILFMRKSTGRSALIGT